MGFMDKLNNLAKKAQDKIQEAQAKIQEVAAQVSSPGVTPVAVQNWYYTRDGKNKIGPCSVEQMKDLAKSGTLLPSDMVMQEGTTKWKPASQVQDFFPASGTTSPPPRPTPPVTSEPAEWHFMQNRQQVGPVTWTQLKQRAAVGQLLATDMVWKNGMAAWAAASTIKDLISTPTIAPPPAPPVAPPPPPPPVPPEPSEWHFTQNGQQAGPVTWTQLRERATSGQVQPGDMVWKSGMAAWAAASTIKDLISTPKIAPPPPLPSNSPVASATSSFEPPSSPQVRFVDNGDNTITDLKHGLMWIKDLRLVTDLEDVSGLAEMDWLTAKERCEQLHYLGHKDWRLCSIPDIKSLTDHPYKDMQDDAVPIHPLWIWHGMYLREVFWTSSGVEDQPESFWAFNFPNHMGIRFNKTPLSHNSKWCAMAVRGVSSSAAPESTPDSTIVQNRPNEAIAYLRRGVQLQDKGKDDEAISVFGQAVRLDPSNAEAHAWLAKAHLAKGHLDDSLAGYKEAARLDKKYVKDVTDVENALSVALRKREQNAKPTRFVDNGDNTITDMAHGLMWIKDLRLVPGLQDVGELVEMDWLTAKEHCEQLRYLNFADWRLCSLPDIKSLTTNDNDKESDGAMVGQLCNQWFELAKYNSFWAASEAISESQCFWAFSVKRAAQMPDQTFRFNGLNSSTKIMTTSRLVLPVRDISLSSTATISPEAKHSQVRTNEAQAYLQRGKTRHLKNDFDKAIADLTRVTRLDPANAEAQEWLAKALSKKTVLSEASADRMEAASANTKKDAHSGFDVSATLSQAVSGHEEAKPSRFVDNGDNTVTDLTHGLMWIKDLRLVPGFEDVGELVGSDWLTAKAKCVQLHYLNHRDWRLCSLPEVKCVMDYDKNDPQDALAARLLALWWEINPGQFYFTDSEDKANIDLFWGFVGVPTNYFQPPQPQHRLSTCKPMPVRNISMSACPKPKSVPAAYGRRNEVNAFLERGRLLQSNGKCDEAIADFKQVIRLDPANADAHSRLAAVLFEKGLLAESLAEYKEAARLDKQYADRVADVEQAISQLPQSHVIDNDDNTVTDLTHGLMWIKDLRLVPGMASAGELVAMEWLTAKEMCDQLHYLGYRDWRLCSLPELKYLTAGYERMSDKVALITPSVNKLEYAVAARLLTYWLEISRSTLSSFWTASEAGDFSGQCWKFSFHGIFQPDSSGLRSKYYALPVRDAAPSASPNAKPGVTVTPSRTNEALAYRVRGEQMQKAGKLDEAIADFSKAIHLDPVNAAYHTWLAEAYRTQGMLHEYVAEYKEAARLDKQYAGSLASANAYCHALRGKAHLEKGMLDESLVEYQEAARFDKAYAASVITIAEQYADRGIDYFEKWVASKSDRDAASALNNFQKALQLDPNNKEYQDCIRKMAEAMNTFAAQARETAIPSPAAKQKAGIGFWDVLGGVVDLMDAFSGSTMCRACLKKIPYGAMRCPYCTEYQDK